MRLQWNTVKKHAWGGGEGKATQLKGSSFEIDPKTRTLNDFKKVVYNNLHTFMRESGDPQFEKPQRYLTITKS